jgi:DNA-binding MarR family transcriptional regulator
VAPAARRPRSARSPQDPFFDLLPLVSRELHQRVWRHLRDQGLTNAQFWVLKWIQVKGPFTPSELAAFLGIRGPSVTAILNDLEKRGYLRRVRSAKDRRVVTLAATRDGLRLLDETAAEVGRVARAATKGVDNADIAAASRVLRRMADSLAASSPHSIPAKRR